MTKILLVDDEPGYRLSVSRLLENDGFQVHVEENAEAALAAAQKEKFDAVVTDIVLPDLSGVELAEKIRETTGAPVVFITGHPSMESALHALRMGASDYVTKPFTKDQLLEALARAMGGEAVIGRKNGTSLKPRETFPPDVPMEDHPPPKTTAVSGDEKVKVCIIDDEESVVSVVEKVLRSRNYDTMGITCAIGSSLKVKRYRPRIVILDVDMPALNGQKLLRLFGQTLNYKPKVILYSGMDPEALEEIAADVGADDFVYKGDGLFRLLNRVNFHALEFGATLDTAEGSREA